jgi:hypothetical protein
MIRGFVTRVLLYAAIAMIVVFLAFLHGDAGSGGEAAAWHWFSARVAIAGLAAVTAAVLAALFNADRIARYLTARRLAAMANVALACIFAAAVLVFANVLAARHYKIFDRTFHKSYSIGDRTRAVLAGLPKRVIAHAFIPPSAPYAVSIRGMLDEYRAAAP